ncbi:glycoside hydrolase family 3 N-terminal domain-containing protein [Liquorilactobacillus hordei]|uniref:beta-N-acetylhexosaminidase n=2 Tax=Liquorilactobacillus hordei TaxID=468911 RepID=A0A0R1MMN0_9LACO|nr:glycoside hydrolase family 3 N-terminal domain-containing protein [Liquorilactobacillus hordei]KRL06661.1 beta-N-acetylhexosaminidase [Liquorilactobacillus hordei DSM 19519]QYH52400.1 beta-N-acetylhexosaminidase [Liquorilactobacillus hordei DSM 19519]
MRKIFLFLVSIFIFGGINFSTVVYAKNVHRINNQQLKEVISKMTLSQKIAQMYIITTKGTQSESAIAIKQYQPGGIILFGNDFKNQTKQNFIANMQNYKNQANLSLIIGTDQEGGTVSRLSSNPSLTNNKTFASPQQLYQAGGRKGVVKAAGDTAKILNSLQINLNFAPVADVSTDPNSFIYERSLGLDYKQTAHIIKEEVAQIQKNKVAASLKHFPGYGTAGDTHTGFATTTRTLTNFENSDFLPFKAGIKAGAQTVLVSHIFVTSIDSEYPASLSPKIHQLLRKKLKFKKVIITDDLSMGAITKFAADKHISPDLLAVEAGNDMLLSNNIVDGTSSIVQAVKNKQIKESQINKSVYRILKLKRDLGILNQKSIKNQQRN